jgi:hypothetical protein
MSTRFLETMSRLDLLRLLVRLLFKAQYFLVHKQILANFLVFELHDLGTNQLFVYDPCDLASNFLAVSHQLVVS